MNNNTQWIVVVAIVAFGCGATLKDVAKTVLDVGEVLCQAFAAEQPEDFGAHVRAAGENPDALSVADLCVIPTVVEPFVGQARGAMAGAKASVSRQD